LVSPDQAETLTLANAEGHIQLVLRNSSDQTIEKTAGRTVGELYNGRRAPVPTEKAEAPKPRPRPAPAPAPVAPPPPVVAVAPPPPPPDQVVMIRGTTRTVEVIPHKGSN
jgi:hypothetical protein